MKKLLTLLLFIYIASSCSVEKKAAKRSLKNEPELLSLAYKIFSQHAGKEFDAWTQFKHDLAENERHFLYGKMNFSNARAVLNEYDYYSDINTDSVVVFTKYNTSLLGNGVDIVVDVHKKPLDSLPLKNGGKGHKISGRIYSLVHPSPIY